MKTLILEHQEMLAEGGAFGDELAPAHPARVKLLSVLNLPNTPDVSVAGFCHRGGSGFEIRRGDSRQLTVILKDEEQVEIHTE